MTKSNLISAGLSTGKYYKSMNNALKSLNGEYRMLHYPLFIDEKDSFITLQENLVDYCISKLPSLKDKRLLDIGCGNGVLAIYIMNKYSPAYTLGVDLNPDNLKIGKNLIHKLNLENIYFIQDDAQELTSIKDDSFDCIVNIESAFHYPDKEKFLHQIYRILKPGGVFVIADILTTNTKSRLKNSWKGSMKFHHWPLEEYRFHFEKSSLDLYKAEDITERVIKGFKNIDISNSIDSNKNSFVRRLFLRIFFKINIVLNARLLKKKRLYFIFSGQKPETEL